LRRADWAIPIRSLKNETESVTERSDTGRHRLMVAPGHLIVCANYRLHQAGTKAIRKTLTSKTAQRWQTP
jgi:hypothetical protein